MNTLRTMCAFSLATTGLLFACNRADTTSAPTTNESQQDKSGVTNMQPTVDTTTVNRLAGARCDREQTCNKIGGGQTYATRAVCIDQMRGTMANELNSYNCPRGLDHDQIDRCLSAIRDEECDHPLDTLQRVDKCRTAAMCLKE
jgi:hypothetical protein